MALWISSRSSTARERWTRQVSWVSKWREKASHARSFNTGRSEEKRTLWSSHVLPSLFNRNRSPFINLLVSTNLAPTKRVNQRSLHKVSALYKGHVREGDLQDLQYRATEVHTWKKLQFYFWLQCNYSKLILAKFFWMYKYFIPLWSLPNIPILWFCHSVIPHFQSSQWKYWHLF